MKIAMVCYFFGSELGFQENHLIREYGESGHQVLVLAPPGDNVIDFYHGKRIKSQRKIQRCIESTFELVRLPFRLFSTRKIDPLKGVQSELNRFKPDLIFIHGLSFNLHDCCAYAKKNPSCRLIMDFHGDLSNSGSNWISRNILHRVIKRVYLKRYKRHIDQIFAITPSSIDFLHRFYGISRDEVELLPLGSDLRTVRLLNEQDAREQTRKKLGLSDSDFLIFTGGKLEPWKMTTSLIRALSLVSTDHVHLVVAGAVPEIFPEYKSEFHNLASANQNVHLAGWVKSDEMIALMLASDLAVFPASQSVIWQQAIAAGLPLIVGELPHQSVAYMNRGNILVLPQNGVLEEQISAAIHSLLDDPPSRLSMGEKSKLVAENELDWSKIALRTLTRASQIEVQ